MQVKQLVIQLCRSACCAAMQLGHAHALLAGALISLLIKACSVKANCLYNAVGRLKDNTTCYHGPPNFCCHCRSSPCGRPVWASAMPSPSLQTCLPWSTLLQRKLESCLQMTCLQLALAATMTKVQVSLIASWAAFTSAWLVLKWHWPLCIHSGFPISPSPPSNSHYSGLLAGVDACFRE